MTALLTLHTLQPLSALHALQRGEVYRADEALCRKNGWLGVDCGNTDRAYRWMAERLCEHASPPPGVSLPVWVWHTHDPDHPRPDLRRHRPQGRGVLLELQIAPERVLLSDFELWHYPLNDWYLGTEVESEAFEASCAARGLEWDGFRADPELSTQVEASWMRCLDLDWHVPDWAGKPRGRKQLQGVLWELRPEDLVRWREFRGWRPR